MARGHGRFAAMYMGIANSSAAAELVPFTTEWTMDQSSDRVDVTSHGESSKVYLQGLPDAQGSYRGFLDLATAQTYTAALDGQPRRVYLYPDRSVGTAGPYWYGTAFFDFSIANPVDGAVAINGTWAAASSFAKIG